MDLENQNRVKEAVDKYGAENIIVLLGGGEAETAGLAAETVTAGDPTWAGPLAGVSSGLKVYHALDPEFKESGDAGVYDEQIGMMEMVLDVDAITSEIKNIRDEYTQY